MVAEEEALGSRSKESGAGRGAEEACDCSRSSYRIGCEFINADMNQSVDALV